MTEVKPNNYPNSNIANNQIDKSGYGSTRTFPMSWRELLTWLPTAVTPGTVDNEWLKATERIQEKIVVLDDDPTGVQTVHSIPVYTSWDMDAMKQAIREKSKVVYILTNSRALTAAATEILHRELITNLKRAAKEVGQSFLVISRSDSTLRGHWPLETRVIYEELRGEQDIDGEIIVPFFFEGGRITFQDTHYLREGETVIPAGRTEFARDATFGYQSSDLKEWIAEKTKGDYPPTKVTSISLEMLRRQDISAIVSTLVSIRDFNKVIVNAVDDIDLKIFVIALVEALERGKRFIFRSAASLIRIMGGITPKPFLTGKELSLQPGSPPGLIIVGSYVQKTTKQLEKLGQVSNLAWVEWDVKKMENFAQLTFQVERVMAEIERNFRTGKDVCLFTSRAYYSDDSKEAGEAKLIFSVRVSEGLVRVVKGLQINPGFIVVKGGITSSDIGVKGLGVKRALVLGQILAGVPVWKLGAESRYPGLSYVIFPGNIGDENALKNVMEVLKPA